MLAALALPACKRDQSVYAGNDRVTHRLRQAPKDGPDRCAHIMKGEFVELDLKAGRFVIRVENGMVQTFRFDPSTTVRGLDSSADHETAGIRSLAGKEGSEVAVAWKDQNEAKLATSVDVTQVFIAKYGRKRHRR
jgi:hypothetical protein